MIYLLEEFGERVKQLRKNIGLSQEKFALKINMDRTYLASVEAGNRNISLKNIEKIADGFDMSISELFKGVENERRQKKL
ncbi:putative transcriptional regulator, PvuIIC [Gemelliphila asaccharolytica]|uniref:Transcriptional regulator, PvuIIC n=1 Tax=Gemelliphila asaccharolytica TaxID=502393 RepID=A0ABR5TKE1_9BACL|nr:putative transcriptional regulator, PvuIIC [Gemella asaccharolytica]